MTNVPDKLSDIIKQLNDIIAARNATKALLADTARLIKNTNQQVDALADKVYETQQKYL
jgi:hypothetical protein